MRHRASLVLVLASAAMGFAACTGTIGGDGEDGLGQAQGTLCAVDIPIRRLTRFEYNNTVRDLLGDTTQPARSFPPEETVQGFNNQAAALNVTELLAEQYMQAAEEVSERATEDMAKLIPYCDEASDGADACAAQFIATFGKRAYRRPLTDDEAANLQQLFDWAMNDPDLGTFTDGIQLVIQAMLQSPSFLYRAEFGMGEPVEGDVVRLSDWEMASRLSYTLWNSMPDDELFAAAEAGELHTTAQIEAQARRMIEDDKARDAIRNFHEQWLLLEEMDTITKDPSVYPNYDDALRPLWKEELEHFVEYAILEDDGSLSTLLTADYSFMNAELAAFYGIDSADAPTTTEFEKVSLDGSQRAGLLTMGALMATHAKADQTSPVHRGKFVREQLMCDILPLPPNDLVIEPPALDSSKTTREQFEEIGDNPDCSFCHKLMNPIGFGFENYDAIGLWRDTQNGKPIDATGEIYAARDDLEGKFDGAVELAQLLANSEQVAECVASQWFRFGYGRTVTQDDSCSTDQLMEAFVASNFNIKELLVALTLTDAYLYRHRVVPAEQGGDQ